MAIRDYLPNILKTLHLTTIQSLPFYSDSSYIALVRYPVDSFPPYMVTIEEPQSEDSIIIRYYKEQTVAESDLSKLQKHILYGELYVNDVIIGTNRTTTANLPTAPASNVPLDIKKINSTDMHNFLYSIFQTYYENKLGYSPYQYFANVIYLNTTPSFPDDTLKIPKFKEALKIVFFKQELKAEEALYKIIPTYQVAELWSNGKILARNQ